VIQTIDIRLTTMKGEEVHKNIGMEIS
jgi:hypothetical protein